MKNFRCLLMAFGLALFVSTAVFAGDMPGVGYAPPPPNAPEIVEGPGVSPPVELNATDLALLIINENALGQLLSLI